MPAGKAPSSGPSRAIFERYSMSENMTVKDIDAELKTLNQRKRILLAERRRLIAESKPEAAWTSEFWAEHIFAIIANHPGASREKIQNELDSDVIHLGKPKIDKQVLTNCLTALRRRAWTENRGTRKHPQWYVKERAIF